MCDASGATSAAVDQVLFDVEAAGDLHLVYLIVFENALYIAAGLGKRYTLDPVDNVFQWLAARIAVALHPLCRAARTGIVADKRQNIGAAEAGELIVQIGRAQSGVVA